MKRAAIFLTLLLPVFLLLGLGYAVNGRVQAKPQLIDVGGSIATDTTWTAANSPYVITETVTVEAGVTLTVEAGVTIMTLDMGQYLDVQGHLEAVGTAVDPILFTSNNDSPANNRSGITVSGSANFANVTMHYAYTPLFISGSSGGDVYLENSVLEENLEYPIVVDTDALHRLKMNNVTFSNNVPDRVGINRSVDFTDKLDLAGNVLLTPQPGLEAYEDLGNGSTPLLNIPSGITLTLAAGTVFMSDSSIIVEGHLEANGTELAPVIFDDRPGGGNFPVNYVVVGQMGSALLVHTIIRDGNPLGLGIGGQSDAPVILQDVVLDNVGDYPIIVEPPALHRLQMTNVTFQNNTFNRVLVDTSNGQDAIVADVTLTAQPGLEWYEFADANTPQTPPAEFVVPEGVTLTVEPGVELRFGDGAETFVVNGRLVTLGTLSKPVTVTSGSDSGAGTWLGMAVNGELDLQNTVVRYGTHSLTMNGTGDAQLENVTLTQSQMAGLRVSGGVVTAVRSHFTNNGTDGILVEAGGVSNVLVTKSAISGNGSAGLRNLSSETVDATENWWGDASGPSASGFGSGDAVAGNVNFSSWLTDERWTMLHYQLYLPSIISP